MLDQLSKNITRCGLSNSTLNYLRVSAQGIWKEGFRAVGQQICQSLRAPRAARVGATRRRLRARGPLAGARGIVSNPKPLCSPQLCVILEPMQELMSRHKTYSLSPRDCLKTCLFQKWQRMVAPPGESALPDGLPGTDGRRWGW